MIRFIALISLISALSYGVIAIIKGWPALEWDYWIVCIVIFISAVVLAG